MNGIFIIGTERSGTNLLRIILNSHSNIAIPHPPHILRNFFKLEPLYFDLEKDSKFKKLINDVIKTVELHPYPWDIKIDKDKIYKHVKERNLINVFFAVYDQYLESTNKKRWGCKSTFMINHITLIKHYRPQAKFIYMVRDGRDVAVSAKKTIFNRYSVYYTAKLWKKEQQTGIYWLRELSENDIFLIRYEDLLNEPEERIKKICLFLNEPYEENMLDFFNSIEARKCSSISAAWRNITSPILKNNSGSFKTGLNKKEVSLFEAIASPELEYFSYKLTRPYYCAENIRIQNMKFRIVYLIEEVFLKIIIQIKYFFSDKNNFLRYKKYWFLKLIRIIR